MATLHDEVEALVREVLTQQCGVAATRVRLDARLGPDLGLDSMMLLVLATSIENRLEILLDEADAGRPLETVGDVIALATARADTAPLRGASGEPS